MLWRYLTYSSPTLFSFVQITKKKKQKNPLTNHEKWWPSEPEQDFIQSSVQWYAGKCLKTHSEVGKVFFVAFANVSGINTTARSKPSMWSQPAHWKFNKWLWADSGTPLELLIYLSAGCIHVVTKLYQGTQWPGSPYWVPNLVWVAKLTGQE